MTEGKPPFIRNVEYPSKVAKGELLIIEMTADWPTPCWEYLVSKINLEEEDRVIIITYLGVRRPGVALQQMTSFKHTFEISVPHPGQWRLVIEGRGENWEDTIEVTS